MKKARETHEGLEMNGQVLYVRQLSDSQNWGSRGREPYTS
jgi:hypothetical protein